MLESLVSLALALVVLYCAVHFLTLPFKLLYNGIIGAVLLLVVNFVGGLVGIHVSIGIINSLIAGIFGVPGVIFLVLYNILLK